MKRIWTGMDRMDGMTKRPEVSHMPVMDETNREGAEVAEESAVRR